MFQNLRTMEDRSVLDTDVCIIGGGAAGITIARELIDSGRDVLVIESGDLEPEGETLALNEGTVVGEPYPPLETARLRFFGGTTNHWDGHCRPLDPIDFEARPWVPHSGWPITFKDVDPYYQRAVKVCELGPYDFTDTSWTKGRPGFIDFNPERIVHRPWQLSPPTRFGIKYREDLERAEHVRVLFNANVVNIGLNDSASAVARLSLKTLEGKTATVRPHTVVLACGGIENPRLLLASNDVAKTGIGNGNDLVGRYFMEHPHAIVAFAVPSVDITPFAAYFAGTPETIPAGSATIRVKPGLSEALQRAEKLPNACLDVGYGYDRSEGYLAARDLGKAVSHGHFPDQIGHALLTVAGDLDGLASGVYHYLNDTRMLWFGANTEQIPNPQSRVTLDSARDAVGMPKTRLDWRLTAQDKEATRRVCRILGEELARLGVGRMRMDEWLLQDDDHWSDLLVRYHEMGTTRMSDDPRTGVVDKNCRVHGIGNFYIAGSSIFPTGGYANPTLTIVALAIRLADQLKTIKS